MLRSAACQCPKSYTEFSIVFFFFINFKSVMSDTGGREEISWDLLCVSIYLALSFLPPKRAAAAFLKKFLAGLDKWKSGTVWQQLEESLSGVKPCGVPAKSFRDLSGNREHYAVGKTWGARTCKKKSCRMMSSKLGRSSGFLDNMLAIKCFAGATKDDGMVYLASLIHL